MRCPLGHIKLLESQAALVDEHLARLLAGVPDGQHLLSMKGIGAALAAAILGETGDVSRFASPEKLVACTGLDPSVYQTGEFVAAEARLSKRGSPFLRRPLWLTAGMVRWRGSTIRTSRRSTNARSLRGKHHNEAIAALCHRLLNRVYIVLLKQKRPYKLRSLAKARRGAPKLTQPIP